MRRAASTRFYNKNSVASPRKLKNAITSVFVLTLTDVMAFFSFLGLATLFLL